MLNFCLSRAQTQLWTLKNGIIPNMFFQPSHFWQAAREHEEADRSLDEQISYLNQKYQAHILRLHCREMDVASAEIRAAFRAGHAADVRSLVPKEVCQYIEQHGLYQEVNV